MAKFQITKAPNRESDNLQVLPISVDISYLREWNNDSKDFVCIAKNGVPINDCIYRVPNDFVLANQSYYILIKYVEAIYEYEWLKNIYKNESRQQIESRRKHLESRWCIIDKNGIEKKEFAQSRIPYLIKDSCIYHLDNNYHNIETGEFYCRCSERAESKDFIFIQNKFDNNLLRRGVFQINKKDGTYTIFP